MLEQNNTAIEVRDLNKSYSKGRKVYHVLFDINLKIPANRVTAIIGESGSGKSVLLRQISGLEQHSGDIYWFGENISKMSQGNLYKQRVDIPVANVFQVPAILSGMGSMREYLTLWHREHSDMPKEEVEKIVIRELEAVGLSKEVLKQQKNELSGGMKKRAELAYALARNPKLLFSDEPTSGLDPINCDKIIDLLRNLKEDKRTVVVATHELEYLLNEPDNIIMLRNGAVYADGKREDIINSKDCYIQKFLRDLAQCHRKKANELGK